MADIKLAVSSTTINKVDAFLKQMDQFLDTNIKYMIRNAKLTPIRTELGELRAQINIAKADNEGYNVLVVPKPMIKAKVPF